MFRVDRILNDSWYKECLALNADREAGRQFCRHDLQHMLDVARITYMLVLEDGSAGKAIAPKGEPQCGAADKEIIYAAGLLHDIARWHEYEYGEDHAAAGARMCDPVLERAGFGTAEKQIITTAIREHRTGGRQASLLGRYLCRADDLSRPCSRCAVRADCYKLHRMAAAHLLLY